MSTDKVHGRVFAFRNRDFGTRNADLGNCRYQGRLKGPPPPAAPWGVDAGWTLAGVTSGSFHRRSSICSDTPSVDWSAEFFVQRPSLQGNLVGVDGNSAG